MEKGNNLMDRRVFLVVMDSFGIGYEPDADLFGDVGSNTLESVVKSKNFQAENLGKMGLFHIDGVQAGERNSVPVGAYGRMREASMGKDTTIGHWEIAGAISPEPLPTYPNGFPAEILEEFSRQTGRGILCNKPYSGTDVIHDYGQEHERTGDLIVYTSADSVFQVAAHEEVIPVGELYRICEIARRILTGKHGVGRVIARPFIGSYPNYQRTSNRHDFSLEPPKTTMLDSLMEAGYETIGVGKIRDIFEGKGISQFVRTKGNTDGMQKMLEYQKKDFCGLCFVNLVDFDMLYGHRNDVDGYAAAVREFDEFLDTFIPQMEDRDILMVTADHGCDPGFPGTDHTREYVPFLAYGKSIRPGVSIGTRKTFADAAATIEEIFGVEQKTEGSSFAVEILKNGN